MKLNDDDKRVSLLNYSPGRWRIELDNKMIIIYLEDRKEIGPTHVFILVSTKTKEGWKAKEKW